MFYDTILDHTNALLMLQPMQVNHLYKNEKKLFIGQIPPF